MEELKQDPLFGRLETLLKEDVHKCNGRIPSFRCGEELYNNFKNSVRIQILKQRTNDKTCTKLFYGTKGKVY